MSDVIKMFSGDTKTFTVTITDEELDPVDCSTATEITATCRVAVAGASEFVLTKTDGDIVVGGVGNNVLTITIPPSDTASMDAAETGTTYLMDIEVTWSATNVQTFPRDATGQPALLQLIIYGDLST